jgi:high-affinity iron transporter
MILSSVIIILGEVLEVAILLSLFMALSLRFKVSYNWIIWSLTIGCAGAIFYATNFDTISQLFDGFGQEVINASIQLGIYICLLLFNTLVYITRNEQPITKYLQLIMALSISLAITREGAEIFLYISGFYSSELLMMPVITGSILGGGIGLSLGILIYYTFINMTDRASLYVGYLLLLFVSAGMILQAVRLLIQIDWLPAQEIIWDVSGWITESSVTGRLLYTLMGYEATPTLIEIQCYIVAILGVLLATGISHYYVLKKHSGH